MDVKVVKVNGATCFQYTALDICTRLSVLRLYRRQNQFSSLEFLGELRRALPFAIRRIQTDHGTEFSLIFALAVRGLSIHHRYIKPRCPDQNGKVERSHRVANEEFWGRRTFATFDEASAALHGWEDSYNRIRFSMALKARTPAAKLAAVLAAA